MSISHRVYDTAPPTAGPIRRVSVIVPMRDEAANIERFVADVASQDYDGELEVLVADGGSTDGSRALLERAAAAAGLPVTVVPNPAGWVSPGLNACIERATGELIVRLDCHSRFPTDYISGCVRVAGETGAWNVGGRLEPRGETDFERAVACAMDSPFGGIGWNRAVAAGKRFTTDTVTFGAFRPEAFEHAGVFDPDLVRNQDDEFNLRLRLAGGTIVLDPSIVVRYRPRGTLRGVWRQYFEYGFWKVHVMRKHRRPTTARSLAPGAFVASLAVLGSAAPLSRAARRLLAGELTLYALAASAFGGVALRRRREPLRWLPRVVAVFAAFHVGYGAGMASAIIRRPLAAPPSEPAPSEPAPDAGPA